MPPKGRAAGRRVRGRGGGRSGGSAARSTRGPSTRARGARREEDEAPSTRQPVTGVSEDTNLPLAQLLELVRTEVRAEWQANQAHATATATGLEAGVTSAAGSGATAHSASTWIQPISASTWIQPSVQQGQPSVRFQPGQTVQAPGGPAAAFAPNQG